MICDQISDIILLIVKMNNRSELTGAPFGEEAFETTFHGGTKLFHARALSKRGFKQLVIRRISRFGSYINIHVQL